MPAATHKNMLTYIAKYGSVPMAQLPLNEVDQLVLCQLAYIPFDGLVGPGPEKTLTIQEAARRFRFIYGDEAAQQAANLFCNRNDGKLLWLLGESKRFGGLSLRAYRNEIDPDLQQQFSAVTIALPVENSLFLAFRGTDDTFTGWKENFNMCYLSPVPSQEKALEYVGEIAGHTCCALRLAGHSKGGNLSVYAATHCEAALQQRILSIVNFDGPGFHSALFTLPQYLSIRERIQTYIPQSSVIGMLFDHEEDYTIVRSRQISVLQHDPYSWDIEETGLVRLEQITRSSSFVSKTVKDWMAAQTIVQREQLVNAIFDVLSATTASTWTEFSSNILKSVSGALHHLVTGNPEARKPILGALKALIKCAANGIYPGKATQTDFAQCEKSESFSKKES